MKKRKTAAKGEKRSVLLVTGLSGAGLSTALKALEDAGWQVVDNLPLALVMPLLRDKRGRGRHVALGIDSRTWDFSAAGLLKTLAALERKKDADAGLLFIDCRDDVLQRRFTETRRPHPLAHDRPVADGLLAERRALRDVRAAAQHHIDTTELNVHELRRLVAHRFSRAPAQGPAMQVMSFGFRNGPPREADLVFDVRFLDNPHWNARLRPLTGLDAAVAAHVRGDPGYAPFFARLTDLLLTLVPRYDREGKRYLTVAVGCTGGRHRSVFVAGELRRWLAAQGWNALERHRDLERAYNKEEPAAAEKKKRGRKTS